MKMRVVVDGSDHARRVIAAVAKLAPRIIGGPHERVLADARAEARADGLNTLGTHGRGALGTLFLGLVAQRVLHGTRLPLLLVH